MKLTDKLIKAVDKKLERFDPLWQSEHGTGGLRSRYYDKTGVAKYREWRGVKDTFYDYTQWLYNLMSMGQMIASAPVIWAPSCSSTGSLRATGAMNCASPI